MMRKYLGLSIISFLSLIPVVIWALMEPLALRFSGMTAAATSLGQLAGLVGMVLFSINLILSSRLKFFDRLFFGINRMYDLHQWLGAIAFSLILFHPLFLVVKFLQFSLYAAALFLLPGRDPAITMGIFALLGMILLMALTFYIKIRYNTWRMFHKFMNIVFVFAILHVVLIPSDISRSPLLKTYILSLALIGLCTGIYRSFLRKYFGRDWEYRVTGVLALNDQVVELEFEPVDQAMSFKAGQFVFVRFPGGGIGNEIHPFSIASAPGRSGFKMIAKSLGKFSSKLPLLKVGSRAVIEGPFGYFSHHNASNKSQIWLAGGVGITPFMGMAESLKNDRQYAVDLYYCTKNEAEAVLTDRLGQLSKENNSLRVFPWYSDTAGRLNGQKIQELSKGLEGKDIFICGPAGFADSLVGQLCDLGVATRNIHLEKFNLW